MIRRIAFVTSFFVCLSLFATERPNFIIIFTDDQDYQDLGCFGSPKIILPEHQAKIAELEAEMRRQQLACYDSGLLPEGLRNNRAKANNMTTHEMVREPKLYPLDNGQ